MTKDEACVAVQAKMAEVQRLLTEASSIMDEHRFTARLKMGPESWHTVEYVPKGPTEDEARSIYSLDDQGLFWCGIDVERVTFDGGGAWLSSGDYGDC